MFAHGTLLRIWFCICVNLCKSKRTICFNIFAFMQMCAKLTMFAHGTPAGESGTQGYLHVLDAPLKYLKHTKWDFYNHSISHWKTTSETCIACGMVASEKCEQKCLDMEMVNLCKTPAGTPAGENYTQGYLHGLDAPLSWNFVLYATSEILTIKNGTKLIGIDRE